MIPGVALPSTTVTIDGEVYCIQLLDAVAGSDLYFKLFNAVGGAFSGLSDIEVKGDVTADSAARSDLVIRAIGAIMKGLSPALLAECRSIFADSCTVQKAAATPKVKAVFAFHFAGRYAHMSKWLLECMKVNFADFLDEGLVSQVLAKFQTAQKGPQASTPPQT